MADEKQAFYAHTNGSSDSKDWQPLEEHLRQTAELAKRFASKLGLWQQGELIGLLHDLGKYSDEFQCYLKSAGGMIDSDADDYLDSREMRGKIDHSTAGAQLVYSHPFFQGAQAAVVRQVLSLCLASHHSGLIDCLSPDGADAFTSRMHKNRAKTHSDEVGPRLDTEIRKRVEGLLSAPETTDSLIRILREIHDPIEKSQVTTLFKQGLLLRFLFSCLIDADRLNTADFEEPHLSEFRNNGKYRAWDELIVRLENRLAEFKQGNKVDVLRREISDKCCGSAGKPRGAYLLTVPTGGGKTLASLRFALYHAKQHKMDRIIYVIPYTSIIEQNAKGVRKFLEDRDADGKYANRVVLEHHSNLTPEDETSRQKILSQDWDCPIIFTTSVQVLDALFGSGTRAVRRVHQLARSVIIFDEVQTIPVRCVHMFNNAVNLLVRNCGSTVLLCTATQPLLNTVDRKQGALHLASECEIGPDVARLFSELKRVEVIDKQKAGGWTSDEIAEMAVDELSKTGSALVVVNTKSAARKVYEKCSQRTKAEIRHLSTSMCPAHRMDVLDWIRLCLDTKNPNPVLCISTQLIEAGVDIDFGMVIRYVAGLDSIAQAAGRCNRNGYRHTGHVFVVNPDSENLDKLPDIKIGKEKAERVLDEFRDNPASFDFDVLGPKAVERYFQYYFYDRASEMNHPVGTRSVIGREDNLLSLLAANATTVADYRRINKASPDVFFRQSFMAAAKVFHAIDSPTQGLIVPYKEGKAIIGELSATGDMKRRYELLRDAQRYSVNVFPHEWKKLEGQKAIHEVQEGVGVYYVDEQFYSLVFGLSMYRVNNMPFLSDC
jgi:CRISPR-associated endonuclease/helicase Cas3